MPFDNPPERDGSPSEIEIMIDQLQRARDYLAPRWGRGSFGFQGDRTTCLVGALFAVTKLRWAAPVRHMRHIHPVTRAQVEDLAEALYAALPRHVRVVLALLNSRGYRHTARLMIYNDTHSRKSVLKLFDQTIARLRADAYSERMIDRAACSVNQSVKV